MLANSNPMVFYTVYILEASRINEEMRTSMNKLPTNNVSRTRLTVLEWEQAEKNKDVDLVAGNFSETTPQYRRKTAR